MPTRKSIPALRLPKESKPPPPEVHRPDPALTRGQRVEKAVPPRRGREAVQHAERPGDLRRFGRRVGASDASACARAGQPRRAAGDRARGRRQRSPRGVGPADAPAPERRADGARRGDPGGLPCRAAHRPGGARSACSATSGRAGFLRLRHRPRIAGALPRQRGAAADGPEGVLPPHPAGRADAGVARPAARDREGHPPPPGPRRRHRSHRARQDEHAGRHRRHREPRDDAPRDHGRGPGRVRAPAQEGDDEPAGGRLAHADVRGGAQGLAARGPRRHRGGGAARHRDGAHGPRGERDGAPGARDDEHAERGQDHRSAHRPLPARRPAAGPDDARGGATPHRQPAPRAVRGRHGHGRGGRAPAGVDRPLEPHP